MINILPQEIFNRISAGEVVERPASIVKELFENAIDAGACKITVSIENGGLDEIYIQDDGCGIEKDELIKAFMPHATSKITTAQDLDNIETLGFRGEALASIGAVCKVKMTSKTADAEIGSQVVCMGGQISEPQDTMSIDGTAITVTDIFFNTPARLKFLKSAKTEEREITSLMEKLILSNPFVEISYYVDNKLIFQNYGDGLKDAVLAVYGSQTLENCYEIFTEKNGIYIRGYIGSTNFYKGNRTYQTITVNGRYVTDNTISMAMQNAYSNYLMKRQYPFYVLSIDLDPTVVDVNVHPRKAEIRFANNQIIYSAVYTVISSVLDGSSKALSIIKSAPFIGSEEIFEEKRHEEGDSTDIPSDTLKKEVSQNTEKERLDLEEKYSQPYLTKPFKRRRAAVADVDIYRGTDFTDEKVLFAGDSKDVADSNQVSQIDDVFKANKEYIKKLEAERNAAKQEVIDGDIPVRYVGQVLSTYIIEECGDELILIDQHAAHERVLFDKYYAAIKNKSVDKQSLLIPYTFTTNAKETEMLYELLDIFKETGFDVYLRAENGFRVSAVPIELSSINLTDFFRDILTDNKFKDEKVPNVLREKIAQKACKSAIKAGDKLSLEEINALIGMLKQNWGLKCPHGRPIAVKIGKTEIDKWFKRIV